MTAYSQNIVLSKQEQETFYKRLGAQIRAARRKEEQSQENLAMMLGFKTRVSIVNIEKGLQKVQLHTLMEIAEYLNLNIQELLPPLREAILDKKTEKKMHEELEKFQDKILTEEKAREFIIFSKSKN